MLSPRTRPVKLDRYASTGGAPRKIGAIVLDLLGVRRLLRFQRSNRRVQRPSDRGVDLLQGAMLRVACRAAPLQVQAPPRDRPRRPRRHRRIAAQQRCRTRPERSDGRWCLDGQVSSLRAIAVSQDSSSTWSPLEETFTGRVPGRSPNHVRFLNQAVPRCLFFSFLWKRISPASAGCAGTDGAASRARLRLRGVAAETIPAPVPCERPLSTREAFAQRARLARCQILIMGGA